MPTAAMPASPIRSLGEGPLDLVVITGPASHLELMWEEPGDRALLRAAGLVLPAGAVRSPRHGPVGRGPARRRRSSSRWTTSRRCSTAVGVERPALCGASDLGLSALFAATYPERVTALVLSGVGRRRQRRRSRPEKRDLFLDAIENNWGDGTLMHAVRAQPGRQPRVRGVVGADAALGRQPRDGAPAARDDLPDRPARGPAHDPGPDAGHAHERRPRTSRSSSGARWLELIPGARFIEYPGADSYGWADAIGIDDVEEFLTGRRALTTIDRVLATVLFTDIVGSTERRLAARRRPLARRCSTSTTRPSARSSSAGAATEIKTIGDGFLATFDGPARAVRCAAGIVDSVGPLGLPCAPGCTPASASWSAATWPGSRSTSARG